MERGGQRRCSLVPGTAPHHRPSGNTGIPTPFFSAGRGVGGGGNVSVVETDPTAATAVGSVDP